MNPSITTSNCTGQVGLESASGASSALKPPAWAVWLATTLLVLGIGLRLWIKTPTDLWEDEIIATTHAVQPLWSVVVDTVRNDVHPPLYFLQLHFWALLDTSDIWLMANSTFWSLGGLASLYCVSAKIFGKDTALIAAGIYAVLPSPVYLSDQLRMYAMLAVFIVWSFYFSHSVFHSNCRKTRFVCGLVILNIAIGLTHAIGLIAILANSVYGLIGCVYSGANYKRWFYINFFCVSLSLPWSIYAAVHDGNVARIDSFHGLVFMLGSSLGAFAASENSLILPISALLFVAIVIMAFCNRSNASLSLSYIVFPLLVAFVAALAVKPFFKWNYFSTVEAPFIAIQLALLLSGARRSIQIFAIVVVLGICSLSVVERMAPRESSHFREIAASIANRYEPGDVVYVPQASYFHGMAWYLDGPQWGSPLEIAAAPSKQWQNIYSKLGPAVVHDLGLMPKTEIISGKRYIIFTGSDPDAVVLNPRRIWMVSIPRADLPAGFPPSSIAGLHKQAPDFSYGAITLYSK